VVWGSTLLFVAMRPPVRRRRDWFRESQGICKA
jgi:hypothetical protein